MISAENALEGSFGGIVATNRNYTFDCFVLATVGHGTPDAMSQPVLRMPCHCCFIYPFAVAGLGFKYFLTLWVVKFGHPFRYPHLIALSNVGIPGLHRDWCANLMLFAFVRMVCAKNAICTVGWAWVSARTGAASISLLLASWEDMPLEPKSRVHKSVAGSFAPCKINFIKPYNTFVFHKCDMAPVLHQDTYSKQ